MIYILGNPERIRLIELYLKTLDVEYTLFIMNSLDSVSASDTILLSEPVYKHYYVANIWNRYLTIERPEIKLFAAGFMRIKNANYIDLLKPPKNFSTFLNIAHFCGKNWRIPIEGQDALNRMVQFFEGHGSSSLTSQLNKIHQSLSVAYVTTTIGENTFEKIMNQLLLPLFKPELESLLRRWQAYYPLFKYLPFYQVMKEIDRTFLQIQRFFEQPDIKEQAFNSQHFDEKVQRITRQLHKIDTLYIRPRYDYDRQNPDH